MGKWKRFEIAFMSWYISRSLVWKLRLYNGDRVRVSMYALLRQMDRPYRALDFLNDPATQHVSIPFELGSDGLVLKDHKLPAWATVVNVRLNFVSNMCIVTYVNWSQIVCANK